MRLVNPVASGRIVFALMLSTALPIPGSPQTDNPSSCHQSTVEDFSPSLAPKAHAFLARLKAALHAGDKRKLAGAMIEYPLSVNGQESHRLISNSREFLRNYNRIFTPPVIKAIENQTPECLFANWQGVMIGNGEVWFQEQPDGSLKIKAVNVP